MTFCERLFVNILSIRVANSVYSAQSGRSGSATLAANLHVKESVFPRHDG